MPTSSTSKKSRVSALLSSSSSLASSSGSSSKGNINKTNNKQIYWPNSQQALTETATTGPTAISKIQIKRSTHHFNSNYNKNSNNNCTTTTTIAASTGDSRPEVSRFVKKLAPTKQPSPTTVAPPKKYNKISHISPPTSLTSTSVALRNSIMVGNEQQHPKQGPLARLLGVASASVGPRDIGADDDDDDDGMGALGSGAAEETSGGHRHDHNHHLQTVTSTYGPGSVAQFSPPPPLPPPHDKTNQQFAFLAGKSFLVGKNSQLNSNRHHHPRSMSPEQQQRHGKSQSQGSLLSQTASGLTSLGEGGAGSNSSSTAQLQVPSVGGAGSAAGQAATAKLNRQRKNNLHIGRRMDLKYIKSMIIILMAIDLIITIFVHQFATNDELNLGPSAWLRSFKLRYSFINLILSSIWFIILIGGILFDIYWILFCSIMVDIISFLVLLGLSVIHFTRRLDYNAVQLTSLLALLFSIVVLHVYLLVMAALTLYLMLAVRRRQQSRRQPADRSSHHQP